MGPLEAGYVVSYTPENLTLNLEYHYVDHRTLDFRDYVLNRDNLREGLPTNLAETLDLSKVKEILESKESPVTTLFIKSIPHRFSKATYDDPKYSQQRFPLSQELVSILRTSETFTEFKNNYRFSPKERPEIEEEKVLLFTAQNNKTRDASYFYLLFDTHLAPEEVVQESRNTPTPVAVPSHSILDLAMGRATAILAAARARRAAQQADQV